MRGVVLRWLSINPAVRGGLPVVALLLGGSGFFGGLDPVPLAERVDEKMPGTEITVEPFDLTFKEAVVLDEIEHLVRPLTPGNHLMVVLLDAENRTKRSLGSHLLVPVSRAKSFLSHNLVILDDRLSSAPATIFDADSNVAVSLLVPGLTYRLALVWEFGGPLPQRLSLGLARLTLRGNSVSPDELEWQDPVEAATLNLPVRAIAGTR